MIIYQHKLNIQVPEFEFHLIFELLLDSPVSKAGMISKNDELPVGPDPSAGTSAKVRGRRLVRIQVWKAACLMAAIGLLPFGVWLVGSGIVLAAPPVYQSAAVLRVDSAGGNQDHIRQAAARLKSDTIIGMAARTLRQPHDGSSPDPMSAYLLWSSLSVNAQAGRDLITVQARGAAPEEARRIVMAVIDAYQHDARKTTSALNVPSRLVYLDPPASPPARVGDETRLMLGVAGIATIGLLLCIPLLRGLELAMPLRRLA